MNGIVDTMRNTKLKIIVLTTLFASSIFAQSEKEVNYLAEYTPPLKNLEISPKSNSRLSLFASGSMLPDDFGDTKDLEFQYALRLKNNYNFESMIGQGKTVNNISSDLAVVPETQQLDYFYLGLGLSLESTHLRDLLNFRRIQEVMRFYLTYYVADYAAEDNASGFGARFDLVLNYVLSEKLSLDLLLSQGFTNFRITQTETLISGTQRSFYTYWTKAGLGISIYF